jgi:hypothetical protein
MPSCPRCNTRVHHAPVTRCAHLSASYMSLLLQSMLTSLSLLQNIPSTFRQGHVWQTVQIWYRWTRTQLLRSFAACKTRDFHNKTDAENRENTIAEHTLSHGISPLPPGPGSCARKSFAFACCLSVPGSGPLPPSHRTPAPPPHTWR